MLTWSPEIEKLIGEFGDAQERRYAAMINPQASVAGSILCSTFNWLAKSRPAYKKICKAAGWTYVNSDQLINSNSKTFIELAKENKSNAADKLERILPALEQVQKSIWRNLKNGRQGRYYFMNMKHVKQQNIRL